MIAIEPYAREHEPAVADFNRRLEKGGSPFAFQRSSTPSTSRVIWTIAAIGGERNPRGMMPWLGLWSACTSIDPAPTGGFATANCTEAPGGTFDAASLSTRAPAASRKFTSTSIGSSFTFWTMTACVPPASYLNGIA